MKVLRRRGGAGLPELNITAWLALRNNLRTSGIQRLAMDCGFADAK
jgi:hypothetical protein